MRRALNPKNAETLALNALSFLAESPDSLESFMRQSGVDPTTIRLRATERDFLAAVLDLVLSRASAEARSWLPFMGRRARNSPI
jgi:hypothetical protein